MPSVVHTRIHFGQNLFILLINLLGILRSAQDESCVTANFGPMG